MLALTAQRKNSTRCLTTVYMIVFERGCNVTRHFLISMEKSTEKLGTKLKTVQEKNCSFSTLHQVFAETEATIKVSNFLHIFTSF